jgi:hypothetical protein
MAPFSLMLPLSRSLAALVLASAVGRCHVMEIPRRLRDENVVVGLAKKCFENDPATGRYADPLPLGELPTILVGVSHDKRSA